ncbi:MAG: hypothetical protein ACRDDJ_24135, partial [[Mycobacterium] stephanolepidis]
MQVTREAEGTAPDAGGVKRFRLLRFRPLSRVSIQSKLIAMMVVCTIVGAAVVGIIAFQVGRNGLRTAVFTRL